MWWLWWGLVATAWGRDAIDVAEAQSMADALVAEVERRAGRPFISLPKVGIQSRAQLRRTLLRAPLEMTFEANLRRQERGPYQPPQDVVDRVDHLIANSTAVYTGLDEKIFLIKEPLEQLSLNFSLGSDALRAALRCVLVHEMVHVLQHQYGLHREENADQRRGSLALREGHAETIASAYCSEVEGPALARLLGVLSSSELEASHDADGAPALYSWGQRLASALQAEDLTWSALIASAPSWAAVVNAVEPTHAPAWRSGEPLEQSLRRMNPGSLKLKGPFPVTPTTALTGYFEGRWGIDAMPRARGGFVAEGFTNKRQSLLSVFFFEEAGVAATLAERRRETARTSRRDNLPMRYYQEINGRLERRPRASLIKLDRPDVTLAVRITSESTGDGPYREYWVATERRLVFLVITGKRVPEDQVFEEILGLLDTMTEASGVPFQLDAMGPWIDEVRAIDPMVSQYQSWSYLLQHAAERLSDGDRTACTVFSPFLQKGAVPDPTTYADAAFQCAAISNDIATATQARALLDRVEAYSAVRLASALVDAQRPAQGLAMLEKADVQATEDVDLFVAEASVRVRAAIQQGDWATVVRLVRDTPALHPQLRAYAGQRLYRAGRRAEGRRILEVACPSLDGDDRMTCRRMLGQ
ncbi:MAG: hypothetical protein AAGA48_00995 [Myxococcota bacterium]